MAALAVQIRAAGAVVSGCDIHSSPRLKWLETQGIQTVVGHDSSHVSQADVVVVTPAVAKTNPEVQAARQICYRGELLAKLSQQREMIAVCGSHGKTTTSTYTAKLLRALGEDPAWAIGGETGDFPVAGVGKGPLVVEADESDGTLALYHPACLVITNCEYDHPDHFPTPEAYHACFETAKRQSQTVIEAEDLPPLEGERTTLEAYGRITSTLAPHNQRNARAAVEVAIRRGHSLEAIVAVLAGCVQTLPDRRFSCVAESPFSVYTDYAHHPTEIACALQMARARTKGKLRVLFQPHRFSRTKVFREAFAMQLAAADEIILCPVYAAFEPPVEGGDSADLYVTCRARGLNVKLARTCAEAWTHAYWESEPGDFVLLLGAGDIINLLPRVEADCAKPREVRERQSLQTFSYFRTPAASVGGGAQRIVGCGSNTWIPDLTTTDEYVRVPGEASRLGAQLGIPWMVGIPGTIGGWIKMNAGAHGHAIGELVKRVRVDGRWLSAEECGFGYRTNAIQGVIEDVEWQEALPVGDSAPYRAKRRVFPARCCGSVFKNPPNDFAGRLLEAVGAKGLRVGGAFVWSEHANVIVAGQGATGSDIFALARLMALRVYFHFGIRLEPEIQGLVV